MHISLDLETTSGTDIKAGVYVYAADPLFAIQLLAYSIDDGPVMQVDLTAGELIPYEIGIMLVDPGVTKRAYNAAFERICLSKHLYPALFEDGRFLSPDGWECTSVRASASGLPASLKEVCAALDLPDGMAKKDGTKLINLFAVRRADPKDYPKEWQAYKAYNVGDVRAEMAVRRICDKECVFVDQELYLLDQRINDRGVMLDVPFIQKVLDLEGKRREVLAGEVKGLTWLKNPNSPAALIKWLNEHLGIGLTSASKDALSEVQTDDPVANRVLAARREMSLASVKKFAPMQAGCSEDGRMRGLFRMNGAGRTGRHSSIRVQLQNLSKGLSGLNIGVAKEIVNAGSLNLLTVCYAEPMGILASLVRPALIATPGNELVIGDFSSIEAVIVAWLAGEEWKLELFRTNGKVYEAAAARMFHRPLEEIIAGVKAEEAWAKDMRAKGKVAELSGSYGGSVAALERMGGAKMGLGVEEMQSIVTAWRKANSKIVQLWYMLENSVKACITTGQRTLGPKGLKFGFERRLLSILLPSGRSLYYRNVNIEAGQITYDGYGTVGRKWGRQKTFGGKLLENVTQAIARDILMDAMLRADAQGYQIVMHVHDEIVADMPEGTGTEGLKTLMVALPDWAGGLPLGAKVETSEYYTK